MKLNRRVLAATIAIISTIASLCSVEMRTASALCQTGGVTVSSPKYAGSGTYRIYSELRYSASCMSNWGRVTSATGTSRYMFAGVTGGGYGALYPNAYIAGTQFFTDPINGSGVRCAWGGIDTNSDQNYDTFTAQTCG